MTGQMVFIVHWHYLIIIVSLEYITVAFLEILKVTYIHFKKQFLVKYISLESIPLCIQQ